MVVARRILRRRTAATAEYYGSTVAELADCTISYTRPRPRGRARFFILLWTSIIFLPEDVQVRAAQLRSGDNFRHRPPCALPAIDERNTRPSLCVGERCSC